LCEGSAAPRLGGRGHPRRQLEGDGRGLVSFLHSEHLPRRPGCPRGGGAGVKEDGLSSRRQGRVCRRGRPWEIRQSRGQGFAAGGISRRTTDRSEQTRGALVYVEGVIQLCSHPARSADLAAHSLVILRLQRSHPLRTRSWPDDPSLRDKGRDTRPCVLCPFHDR
jgi:hypothetical protein